VRRFPFWNFCWNLRIDAYIPEAAFLDSFRFADQPEGGQISKYKGVVYGTDLHGLSDEAA
jgi:hypothetical protein